MNKFVQIGAGSSDLDKNYEDGFANFIKKNKLKEGDHICLLDNSNIEHILKDNNIISYELLTLMGDRLHRNY